MTQMLNPLATAGTDLVLVVGSFLPNGSTAGAIAAANITNGREFVSISRTGVGTFLITFTEYYPQLVSKWAEIQANAPIDLKPQFGAYTAGSGPPMVNAKIVLSLLTAGAAADMAANANNRVSFGFVFRKTSVQT